HAAAICHSTCGYANISTAQRYIHLDNRELADAPYNRSPLVPPPASNADWTWLFYTFITLASVRLIQETHDDGRWQFKTPAGAEPGLRPSQSRVHPPHSEDHNPQHPTEESNLVLQLRTLPCFRHTRRASTQYPDLESNRAPPRRAVVLDLRRVQCDPLHYRDK